MEAKPKKQFDYPDCIVCEGYGYVEDEFREDRVCDACKGSGIQLFNRNF